jgi:hypothetical protein
MDFRRMFQTWINVITKPSEATFDEERHQPEATLTTALIWMAVAGVIAAIFGAIGAGIQGMMGGMAGLAPLLDAMPPDMARELAPFMVQQAGGTFASVGIAFCVGLFGVPLGFLIGSGIWFVLAKLFGGTGEFEEQSYLLATFSAPLTIVSSVLGVIPLAGPCLSFFLGIYQQVLTYFAMKVSHNMTSGRALGVVLTPVIILLLCLVCTVMLGVLGGVGAMMGSNGF